MKLNKIMAIGLGTIMAAGISLSNLTPVSADTIITEAQAKAIMQQKVPGATIVKIELDRDDGILMYEGELVKGNMEYDIDVNANTGKIISFESDYDDDYYDDLYDDDYDGITTAGVNVRGGASTSYSKIGYLAKGTKVDIEKKMSNGWYKIEYKGSYGYVSGKYVKVYDYDYDDVYDYDYDGVTTAGVNVRSGASTSYSKIGYLTKGTKIDIEKKMSNGWYKIEYKGSYGYISGKYVKVYDYDYDDNDDGITTAGVNVRSGASTSYSKIGYLAKGTKVDIEKKMSNGWYKIEYKGSYGYISGKYVKVF